MEPLEARQLLSVAPAPAILVLSPAAGSDLNASPTVTGIVSDLLGGAVTLQAQVDFGTPTAIAVSPWHSFRFPTGLTNAGAHFVELRATDAAGNVAITDVSFSLATNPPLVTIGSPVQGLVTNTNVTIAGQASAFNASVASLTAQVDATTPVGVTFGTSGQFQFTTNLATDGSQDGSHTVTFQATDSAGNVSTPKAYTFTLDTAAPTLTLTSPSDGGTLAPGVTLTGTASPGEAALTSVTYAFDGAAPIPVAFNPADGSFDQPLALSGMAAGNHTLAVTAEDAAGNTASQTLHVTLAAAIPPSTVEWINPSGGDWSDPSNWDTGQVPGPGDDVIINEPGNVPITYDQGATTIHSLVSQDPLTLAGGSLEVTGTVQVNNTFTLAGGTLSRAQVLEGSGGQDLTFTTTGGTLDGVTTDANLDLTAVNGANATITDGLTLGDGATVLLGNGVGNTGGSLKFNGTQTLGGTGTVLFGKDSFDELILLNGSTLTLGSGITVRGSSGFIGASFLDEGSGIVNQGTIIADDSGADTGIFSYDSGFINGTNGSTSDPIDTSGVANPAPESVYQSYRQGSSFYYQLLDLTPGASYTLRLHFADPISTAVGQRVFAVNANSRTLLNDYDIYAAAGGKDKAVVETFTVTANAQGDILLQFLTGSVGTVGMALVNGIELDSGGVPVQAIDCGGFAGGSLTISPSTFINQGTIAVANKETLAINGLTGDLGAVTLSGNSSSLSLSGTNYVVDQGLAVATGQTLSLGGTWSNATGSTITADGGTLDLGNAPPNDNTVSHAWSNQGTIAATNSTVNLGGSFTLAALGQFSHVGDTINLTGLLDDTGTGLALDASTGSWNLAGGTILSGTYSASGGAELDFTQQGGTLDGVTADSNLDLTSANNYPAYMAGVTIKDGLTLGDGATVLLGNASGTTRADIAFDGTQTLGGTGTVLFGGYGSGNQLAVSGGSTLTLGSGIIIRGAASSSIQGNAVVNQGTIVADAGGMTGNVLTVSPTTFVNQGTLLATDGGFLSVRGLTGNLNSAVLDSSGSGLSLGGTGYTITQGLAAVSGQTITLDGTWINANSSAIVANGAVLNLGNSSNAWSNQGTITATGSTVNLGGRFTLAALGSFQRSGGLVRLLGTLDDTGTGLALDASTGSWRLAGGTILSGTYSASGGAELVFTSLGGTLDGVTADSDLDLAGLSGANATITDGLTLGDGATVLLGNAAGSISGSLTFNGTQTLGGTGTVLFGASSSNAIHVASGTLTVGGGIIVIGSSGSIQGTAVVNQGTIDADASGGAVGMLTIRPTTFTNQGSLQANNGETLSVSGLAPNAGTIAVGVGSKVAVTGGFVQGATGIVSISVGGTSPGLYGVLTVSGSATLGGTLDVSLVNGYSPMVNDRIPILTFGSGSGQFATVNVANLPQGIAATLVYNATNVTLLFGNALMANVAGAGAAPNLDPQQLAAVVAEGVEQWAAAGLDATGLALLGQVDYRIVGLPDAELGMQDGLKVWIDADAAGHGWFLDASPASDRADFQPAGRDELHAPAGSPAAGLIDLLTVVVHEMGHVLGLEDGAGVGLMDATLKVGIRRLPTPALAHETNDIGAGSIGVPAAVAAPTLPSAAAVDHLFESDVTPIAVVGPLAWLQDERRWR